MIFEQSPVMIRLLENNLQPVFATITSSINAVFTAYLYSLLIQMALLASSMVMIGILLNRITTAFTSILECFAFIDS